MKNHPRFTSAVALRHIVFPTLLATLLLYQAGCNKSTTPVEKGNRTKTLLLGNSSEPKDLDPHIVTGVTEFNIMSALLEGLVGEDPKTLAPIPAAAASWDISTNRLSYTFHLRPNAKWSNGDSLTADDFVFSYRRILTRELGSPYAYMLFCLKNAEEFNHGKITDFGQVGVKAIDAHTLRLTLKSPTPYFLSLLTHFSWYPVHPATILAHGSIATIGNPWTKPKYFVGNGPFVLKAWTPNKVIKVEKSPTYWDRDNVKLNAINFFPIGDHVVEERAFRAGQLHVTGTVPTDRIKYYQTCKPDLLHLDPYLGTYYYLFNVKHPPLDNPKVRRALSMAIDREQITRFVTRGSEIPAYNFTPPDTGGYTAQSKISGTPATARKLLAEAGYPGGKGFPRLTLLYNTSESHARIAEVIQQMWKKELGIQVELVNMEWKVYLAQTQSGNYDIARAAWIGDYLDPNTFLNLWLSGGGNNRTGWANADYDRHIKRAANLANQSARFEEFQQAEKILMQQSPIMPIYFMRSKSLIQPSVKGWFPNLLDHHPYKYVSLSDN